MADLSAAAQNTLAGLRGQLAALSAFRQQAEVRITQAATSLRIQFYSEAAERLRTAARNKGCRGQRLRIAAEQLLLQSGEVHHLLRSEQARLAAVYLADRDLKQPRAELEDSFQAAFSLDAAKRQLLSSVEALERQLEAESQATSQALAAESEARENSAAAQRAMEALCSRRALQLSELPALQQEHTSLQAEVAQLEQELAHLEKINAHVGERKAILQVSLQTLSANLRIATQITRANSSRRPMLGRNCSFSHQFAFQTIILDPFNLIYQRDCKRTKLV